MDKRIRIKVCGMRQSINILDLAKLEPDYMGFIFYPSSKRFASDLDVEVLKSLSPSIKKTGVFVDATQDQIIKTIETFKLDAIQLHGSETADFCSQFKSHSLEVIKSFGIDKNFNFNSLNEYNTETDYFLFDTKSQQHGGSGISFDWNILSSYTLNKPYFLSGGLSTEHISDIINLNDSRLYAVDLNSRFETESGVKNIEQLKTFFTKIKSSAVAENKSI